MYIELKTSDQDLVLDVIRKQIETGKPVRIALDKSGDLHRLSLSHIPEEASQPT